jgi:hypothetical protein
MTTIVVLLVTHSLGPILSINQPASAMLTHSKNVECAGALHTQNFSDRYHLGKVDCQAGHDYLGVILHKLRIGEMDTKRGGTGIDVEFHDDDDGL